MFGVCTSDGTRAVAARAAVAVVVGENDDDIGTIGAMDGPP